MTDKDVILTVQEIVPGETDRIEAWFEQESENKAEVKEALREEGVFVESAFVNRTDEGDYLYYYIEAADFEEALSEFKSSEHDNIQEFQALVDEALVGGMDAYHEDRAENIFSIVVDPESRVE